MTTPRDADGSTRITPAADTSHTPTSTGSDVTGRMSGTSHTIRPTGTHTSAGTGPTGSYGDADTGLKHKTSAAAVFALVFGLSALFSALTGLLAPAAVVFGLIGIVLGVVALKMTKRPGVHGHGVAVGGLVTAVLGLLLGGLVIAGAAAIVNSDSQLDRISNQIDKLRDNVPSGQEITDTVQQ